MGNDVDLWEIAKICGKWLKCSGVQCTHCSSTKIFGNCDTSRPSLHSSRKQVSIFFFSMHVAMSQFFQEWRLERCKTVVLVDNKNIS